MAHPAIIASISVAAVSSVYAYILQIKKDRKAVELRNWVIDHYPEVYDAQPWHQRWLLKSEVVLKAIYKKNQIDDTEFISRYDEMRASDNRFLISLGIGVLAIVFTIVGSKYLGWEI